MKNITYTEFQSLLKGTEEELVIVKAGADWCAPCKSLGITLSSISEKYPGVSIYNIDISNEKQFAAALGVTSIPLMIFIRRGTIVKTIMGSQTGGFISTTIDTLLSV